MLIKAVFVWLKMQLNTYNAWNTRESMILQKSLKYADLVLKNICVYQHWNSCAA